MSAATVWPPVDPYANVRCRECGERRADGCRARCPAARARREAARAKARGANRTMRSEASETEFFAQLRERISGVE